jgi:hypothetical protein
VHPLSCWDLFNFIRLHDVATIRIAVSFHLLGVDSTFGFCSEYNCQESKMLLEHKEQISARVSQYNVFVYFRHK